MAHAHAAGFLAIVNDAKSRVREFTIEEYGERLKRGERWVLVDVREDNEWAKSRIPGAVHLSKGVIERDIEARFPEKAEPLVLQCGGGFRSALVADNLQKMGYTNVVSLDGGIRGWQERGLPIEQGPAPRA
jgi:rhodanese-related sulfurtransferase